MIKIKILLISILILLLSFNVFSQHSNLLNLGISEKNEMSSFISFDGNKMIYVTYIEGFPKFYETQKSALGNWEMPKSLDDINNFYSNAYINAPVYNHDATRIYFEADYTKDSSDIDIFFSDRTITGWTEPESVGVPLNSLGYDGEPSISPDGLSFFFVRQNAEVNDVELNCKRIMNSTRIIDGNWSEPQSLPEPININCERSPRILSDNKTLLFSSIREGGKGGYDLYFAKQLAKNVWLLPIPMDTFNTDENEIYPSCSFWGDNIYFSNINEKKKIPEGNIYYSSMPQEFKPEKNLQLKGKILDIYTDEPVESKITIYDPKTTKILGTIQNYEIDGSYFMMLPFNEEFLIDYSGNNYSHVFENISTFSMTENQILEKNVSLYNEVHLFLNVFDKDIFEPQGAKIIVKDLKNSKTLTVDIETIDVGRFDLTLPIGTNYKIEIQKTYFETFFLPFDLTGVIQFDEFERDIELISRKEKIDFYITDAESKEGVEVNIEIINLNTNEKYTTYTTTDANGKATIELREGDTYEINMSPKGYAFYNTTLNLEDEDFTNTIDVELTPLNTETKFELNNITFETNSDALNSGSFTELDRVVKLMIDNPNIKIEISAHTDNVGSDVYNLKLSDRRAQSVVKYLIDNDISLERLVAKGYGELVPLFTNDTDENKAKNRRVELKIIEI